MTTPTLDRAIAAGYQPCTAQAVSAPADTPVWSVKLHWGIVSGTMYRDRYGASGGHLGTPSLLTVRKAAGEYLCGDCRHVIARGSLHGSNAGAHFCGCCVTTVRPDDVFKGKVA
jgi:hypothetical protein